MKKAIIYAVVACLLSLGGTTAFVVKTHKAAPLVTDSVGAKQEPNRMDSTMSDTLRHAAAHRDSTVKKDSTRADTARRAVKPDSATGHAPVAQVAPTAAPPSPVHPAAAPVDPAAKAAAYKQVARVLSAMKPVEAAKVLAFLSDEEVEGLLRAVGPRQAADFLTNIPKERAAGLSRRLLVPNGQSR